MHRCPSFRTSFRRVQRLRHARRRRPTVAPAHLGIISKTEIGAGVEYGKLRRRTETPFAIRLNGARIVNIPGPRETLPLFSLAIIAHISHFVHALLSAEHIVIFQESDASRQQ